MKQHATTDLELARVHAPAVAAAHRCVRTAAIVLASARVALNLTLERRSAHATARTTIAKRLDCDPDPSALST